jgi:hypothetical protein
MNEVIKDFLKITGFVLLMIALGAVVWFSFALAVAYAVKLVW